MRDIRRKLHITTCEVVDDLGNVVATMEHRGTASAPRMANMARAQHGPLVTVRNVEHKTMCYTMTEADFVKYATATPVND